VGGDSTFSAPPRCKSTGKKEQELKGFSKRFIILKKPSFKAKLFSFLNKAFFILYFAYEKYIKSYTSLPLRKSCNSL